MRIVLMQGDLEILFDDVVEISCHSPKRTTFTVCAKVPGKQSRPILDCDIVMGAYTVLHENEVHGKESVGKTFAFDGWYVDRLDEQ